MSAVLTTSNKTKTDRWQRARSLCRPLKAVIQDLVDFFRHRDSPTHARNGYVPEEKVGGDGLPLPAYSVQIQISHSEKRKLDANPTRMLTSCILSKTADQLWNMVKNMKNDRPPGSTVDKNQIFEALERLQKSEAMEPYDLNQKAIALISRPGLLSELSLLKIIEGEEYNFETKKAAARACNSFLYLMSGSMLATPDPLTKLPLMCFMPNLMDRSAQFELEDDEYVENVPEDDEKLRNLTAHDVRVGSRLSAADFKRYTDDRECFLNAIVNAVQNEYFLELDVTVQKSIVASAIVGVTDWIKKEKDVAEHWQSDLDKLRDEYSGVLFEHRKLFARLIKYSNTRGDTASQPDITAFHCEKADYATDLMRSLGLQM